MQELLEQQAADLAVTIATRLLGRVPPEIRQPGLPGRTGRPSCRTSGGCIVGKDTAIEVRSAAPLDVVSQSECRDMLTRVLGNVPETKLSHGSDAGRRHRARHVRRW